MKKEELDRLKKGDDLLKEIEELKEAKQQISMFKGSLHKKNSEISNVKIFLKWNQERIDGMGNDPKEEPLQLPVNIALNVLFTHIENEIEIKQKEFDAL
jgi:hypothetical protein